VSDYDPTVCNICGRQQSDHVTHDGGTVLFCDSTSDSPIYWPYSAEREHQRRARRAFVEACVLASFRRVYPADHPPPSVLASAEWDRIDEEESEWLLEWHPTERTELP
jgi:hypothetical protein